MAIQRWPEHHTRTKHQPSPGQRRLGNHLSDEQCRAVRLVYPDDDCFRGWTFPEPIDATAVHYQIGAEKKWSLPARFYATAGADHYGKIYPKHTNYNDLTTRFSAGLGYADQRSDIALPRSTNAVLRHDPTPTPTGARLHYNHCGTQAANLSALKQAV
ncbi:surface lipoprotein assembly modifier [Neisseria subflava]|uniref:surface lipoprotein assembly modifier n=1 Tax=Neisseria subflava TaxID=28449 RepID=UPI002029C4D8|nr:surface lipoprotein assembly modifier [Neisseria subflava]